MHPSIEKFYIQNRFDLKPLHVLPHLDRVAVIIEPRDVPLLRWTISNIIHFTQWPVVVFHSKRNAYALEGLPLSAKNEIPDEFSIQDYNNLLTSVSFWSRMPEHVLIFQSDSFMLRSGIERFLIYDYIGAPWTLRNMEFHKIQINTGNGGFSLRNRNKMLQLIQKFPYTGSIPEDIYFSYAINHVGGKLPSLKTQMSFSVEQLFYPTPLAVHAPWLKLKIVKVEKILAYKDSNDRSWIKRIFSRK